MTVDKYDLEDRLIRFAVSIISQSNSLKKTYAGKHLAEQLIRSGTSPALNYGEAQGAESTRDFIHKLKLILKVLRESYNCLRIIHQSNLSKDPYMPPDLIKECNELISIFVKSIKTAQSRKLR